MLGLADVILRRLEQSTDAELQAFGEIAVYLSKIASETDRAKLARIIAPHDRMPLPLALCLADDTIAVAMPVLSDYPSFPPETLLDLAERLGDTHLQVLARRPDLCDRASDTLIRRGSKPVHRILAGNRDIKLSRYALRSLVKRAARDVVLREDLLLRSDLTPAICRQVLPHADDRTQKRLRTVMEESLTPAQLDRLAHLRQLRRSLGPALDQSDTKTLWAQVQKAGADLDDLVTLMLQDGRLAHVAQLLAEITFTSEQKAKDALFKGHQADAVELAHMANLRRETFELLARTRFEAMKMPQAQARGWIDAFAGAQPGRTKDQNPNKKTGDFAAKRRKNRKPRASARSTSATKSRSVDMI